MRQFWIPIKKARQNAILEVFSMECFLDPTVSSSRMVISGLKILWFEMVMWWLSSTGSLVGGILNIGNLQRLYSFGAGRVIGRTMWCEF